MKFLIRTDVPFKGNAQSVLLENGTVAWSGGMTPEEYAKDRGFTVRVVTDEEMSAMVADHVASLITPPAPITAERWDDMLNVLPPARWHHCYGVELFHVIERITGDLVTWYAKIGDQHFEMNNRVGAKSEDLALAVRKAANK